MNYARPVLLCLLLLIVGGILVAALKSIVFQAAVVEVGPVEQCPLCSDAGLPDCPDEVWSELAECQRDRMRLSRWRELVEQCTAKKLEIKR